MKKTKRNAGLRRKARAAAECKAKMADLRANGNDLYFDLDDLDVAEDDEWTVAVENFASFHGLHMSDVDARELEQSSAGVGGWADARLDARLCPMPGARADSLTLQNRPADWSHFTYDLTRSTVDSPLRAEDGKCPGGVKYQDARMQPGDPKPQDSAVTERYMQQID